MQACVRGGGVCAGGPFCCTKSAKYTSLCVRAHCVCVTHARVRMLSRARALSLCACVHACTEREGNTRMDEYSQNYTTRMCIRRVFLCACKGFLCIRACVCVRLRAFAYSLPGRERTHKHTHTSVFSFVRACVLASWRAQSINSQKYSVQCLYMGHVLGHRLLRMSAQTHILKNALYSVFL